LDADSHRGPRNHVLDDGSNPPTERGTLGDILEMPRLDILNVIREGQQVTMQPLAIVNVTTC